MLSLYARLNGETDRLVALLTVRDISYCAKSLATCQFIILAGGFFIYSSPWPVNQKVNLGHRVPFFHRFSIPCWRT